MESLSSVSTPSVLLGESDCDRSPAQSLPAGEITPVMVIQEREVAISTTEKSAVTPGDSNTRQAWKVFATTFITIFLAELGDKTQVSTLLMSAESHAPWVVFTGAAAALISTSLLSVLIGRWLSCHLSPKTLDRAAGIMLALISTWLFWDIWH